MGNFLYPRTITITRNLMVQTPADGLHETEVEIAKDIAASIQLKRQRPTDPHSFPAATQSADTVPEWLILFKGDRDLVMKADKITDDLGVSYQVEAPYWNSLGWNIVARVYHP